MNLKKITNNLVEPRRLKHLQTEHLYTGFGPRQSMDQKITFINENNNLAERIMKIAKRPVDLYHSAKVETDSNTSILSRKSSKSKLFPQLHDNFRAKQKKLIDK